MKIEKKIIRFEAADFVPGKIIRWEDMLLLFDISRAEMLQISTAGEILNRVVLRDHSDIIRIDAAFFNDQFLLVADSLARQLCRFKIAVDRKVVSIKDCTPYPLPPGLEIVSVTAFDDGYLILDKGNSMIRIYNQELQEIKTLGSRMGYILEYEDEQNLRLGFEFPEDMAISEDGNRILVSDSGNKRLVVFNRDGELETVIRLPEFPFKIIAWDEAGDRLLVSDFNRSLMVISLKYGYIDTIKVDHPVDFYPSIFHPMHHMVGSENGNEIVELTFDDTSLEIIANKAGNYGVVVKILADTGRLPEARELVNQHEELLPEYTANTGDEDVGINQQLADYVNKTYTAIYKGNETLEKKVMDLSFEFIKLYKTIPDSEDQEAANIDKENIRHRLFLVLKQYRRNLKDIAVLKKNVVHYPVQREILSGLLEARFKELKPALLGALEIVRENLDPFNESRILEAFIRYWLLVEEQQVVLTDRSFNYEALFDGKFLLAVLNDFYYSIAELHRLRHRVEEYISFCDREITMYPDKMNIFTQFTNRLIRLEKYDDVLRMLKKFPDQNKENVNFFYYQVCLARGETDAAFMHLKKELDLYSHRVNLIPKLIELNKLSEDEVQQYIDKILEKSGWSIDVNLLVAKSFLTIGNYEKAELYVDRELALFPENKAAVFMKLKLFYRHEKSTTGVKYYRNVWVLFKAFMRINMDEKAAQRVIPFFEALNFLPADSESWQEMVKLRDNLIFESYKSELNTYLSFLKYFQGIDILSDVEKYDHETYLSAYSTGQLSYEYLCGRAEQLKDAGQWEELFAVTESILKYHPGDERIFRFLNRLPAQKS